MVTKGPTSSVPAPTPADKSTPADAAAAADAALATAKATDAATAAPCAATAHIWGLPEKNPFNSADLTCSFSCKRCGVPASFTIAVGK